MALTMTSRKHSNRPKVPPESIRRSRFGNESSYLVMEAEQRLERADDRENKSELRP